MFIKEKSVYGWAQAYVAELGGKECVFAIICKVVIW